MNEAKLKQHLHMAYMLIANEWGQEPREVEEFIKQQIKFYSPKDKPTYRGSTGEDYLKYIEENYK